MAHRLAVILASLAESSASHPGCPASSATCGAAAMAATSAVPQIYPIMGTMTIGSEGQVKPEAATKLLQQYLDSEMTKVQQLGGLCMLDTARVYQQAFGDGGDTESSLRDIIKANPGMQGKIHMATKAAPMVPPMMSLSRQSVIDQCNTSLQRLGVQSVDLYYLHMPDINVDLNETLAAIKQLHEEGKFKAFGLSNYPAWMVVDIWYKCKEMNMIQPSVYQGMYNLISRTLEPELVAVCRQFGMKLYIYNPLAGGLLTGRYSTMQDLENAQEGRFSSQFDDAFIKGAKAGALYKARYSKQPVFDGIAVLIKALDEVNADAPAEKVISFVDMSLRWLLHHSMLTKDDGIILGFSKPEQLSGNLKAWTGGPLPESLIEACDLAAELAKPVAEPYFRNLGSKPGMIDKFLAIKAKEREQKESQ